MKRNATILMALAGMVLMAAGQATADTITLTPTADVGLNEWDPAATGNPAATSLGAGWSEGKYYKALVQFPTWTPGPGETLVSAELKMYFKSHGGALGAGLPLNIRTGALDSAWDESTVTYGTIPAKRSGVTYGNTRVEADETANWKSFDAGGTDATTAVQDWIDTGQNFGMLLEGQFIDTGWHTVKNFSSREDTDFEPQLVIPYPPEPATMGLLSIGGLGMLIRRKRK